MAARQTAGSQVNQRSLAQRDVIGKTEKSWDLPFGALAPCFLARRPTEQQPKLTDCQQVKPWVLQVA